MAHASLSRRDWLKLSAAGVVSYSLSGWLGQFAEAAGNDPGRRRSCILLWMNGGPSHIDTFDPKPEHANGGPFQATSPPQCRASASASICPGWRGHGRYGDRPLHDQQGGRSWPGNVHDRARAMFLADRCCIRPSVRCFPRRSATRMPRFPTSSASRRIRSSARPPMDQASSARYRSAGAWQRSAGTDSHPGPARQLRGRPARARPCSSVRRHRPPLPGAPACSMTSSKTSWPRARACRPRAIAAPTSGR